MKNNDPIFWPDDEVDLRIRQNINKNYNECINILQTQWYQADLDDRFAMGDQDIWGQIFPGVTTQRRKMFNFNLIKRAIQMPSGYQRRNRKTTISIPILSSSQKTADQMTKCLFHVHNQSGAYQVYSDAFEMGALTSGIGFIGLYLDSTSDPISPDIKMRYIDFRSCIVDPFFRKHDMSDARFFRTRQFFGKEEAAAFYPKWSDEILSLAPGQYRDDKFYYMPEVYQIQYPNVIAMDEYWYSTHREATFLVDTQTQECQEFEGTEEQLQRGLANPEVRKRLKVIKQSKPTVRRTILLNDRVMVDEPNPYGLDCYPVVPVLGYFNPNTAYYAFKFRGIVRDLRDSQYLFNRQKVSALDILDAQQQGLKIKQGCLTTPDDALNGGHGRVLTIKKEYQMTDVEQMQIVPPAPAFLQMEEMLKMVMMEISGINEELLGSAVDDKAGILSMMRQGAGLTTLQKLFDQLDESQRICGDIIVQMIQKNWSYGKVKQIIGEEPTEEFDSKLFFKYGAKVVQGVLTDSQQQLEAQQLLYLREIGIPVSSKDILAAITVQNKDQVVQNIMQAEQAQAQQQQQMAQLQMQQIQVDNKTKLGYAQAQEAQAIEKISKSHTDRAEAEERMSKSKEERSLSILNFIKALKELRGMDVDHLAQQVSTLAELHQIVQEPEENSREEMASAK